MRTAKVISISLPPDMNEELVQLAKEERRSVSEVFREALRQYVATRVVADVRKQARKAAKKKGIKPSDMNRIVHESRK